jgi:hypothetical protein
MPSFSHLLRDEFGPRVREPQSLYCARYLLGELRIHAPALHEVAASLLNESAHRGAPESIGGCPYSLLPICQQAGRGTSIAAE